MMRKIVPLLGLLSMTACYEGTLAVKITDGPFPATEDCLSKALVTVSSVSFKGEDGFVALPLVADAAAPMELDLLVLRSGIADDLAAGDLPTGVYDEMRIVISGATLQFADGTSKEFKVPSGQSSGIKVKIDPAILIAARQTTPLLLDVDLSRSFHVTGHGGAPTCEDLKDDKGKVIFHPVIRAINPDTTGVLAGTVVDETGTGVGDVELAVFAAGTVVEAGMEPLAATFSAPEGLANVALGSYALHLDPGNYDLYVMPQGAEAYAKAIEGVVISEGALLADQNVTLP